MQATPKKVVVLTYHGFTESFDAFKWQVHGGHGVGWHEDGLFIYPFGEPIDIALGTPDNIVASGKVVHCEWRYGTNGPRTSGWLESVFLKEEKGIHV